MKSATVALPQTGHYIVAVSGGVDSVALLHMLLHQPDHDLHLRVAHVNHGLRPDADSDERFVQQLARSYDLPFASVKLNLGQASEAEARDRRYEFLKEQMVANRARAIITAHHGDDQLETSLFNTLRGSGRHGQAAALKRRQVLRPLLNLTKADLVDYAKSHSLAWREDPTNQDRTIDRNFIRHELIDPDFSDRHRRMISQHSRLNKTLDQRLAKQFYQFRASSGIVVPRVWLATQTWPVAAAFCHYALRQLAPETEFSRTQIEELVRLAKTAPAGTELAISGLKLQVGYDTVTIAAETNQPVGQPKIRLTPQTSLKYGPFWLSFGSIQGNLQTQVWLNPGDYWVRTAQPGDRMRTAAGTKKIQDIFVDAKVPRAQRQQWPIITSDNHQILWLPHLMIDPEIRTNTEGFQLIAEEA